MSTNPSDPAMAQTVPSEDGLSGSGPNEGHAEATRNKRQELCGATLHHFRVEALVGQGGMGAVYRGQDLSLDRPVALKVVDAVVVEDSTVRDRFIREARAQARLNHPHVVQIYYIGEQEGLSFFAMELVEGGSLDDLLVRGERIEWSHALDLMIDVAEALKLAHHQGIVHRDIKPSNLLLDRSGRVKVADFGLAKWVKEDAKITQEGHVLGTPLYMSPEQGQGEAIDQRSDIYSLGATFYHLIAGKPPFTADTPMAIVVKQITQPLPPLRTALPDLPEPLTIIIERMMSKDPTHRYADYDELIATLHGAKPQKSPPAGLAVRSMAFLIDLVIISLFATAFGWFVIVPYVLYQVLGWWRRGQTIGKWLFRLQVRSRDNMKAPLGSCISRCLFFNLGLWIVMAISIAGGILTGIWSPAAFPEGHPLAGFAGLGLISSLLLTAIFWGAALFRRDRRGLYDLLSRTAVFYRLES